MDKRIVTGSLVLMLVAFSLLGLALYRPITLDATLRTMPIVGNIMVGRLDIAVNEDDLTWGSDSLFDTNTGDSIVGERVAIGTKITFSGHLNTKDGQPVPNWWVAVNLMRGTDVAESGNQCWLGSARTDAHGEFGVGYYFQPRSDGWWVNYPADGYTEGYIQVRNGAGNLGCETWVTQNPNVIGGFYVYAALSPSFTTGWVAFTVGNTVLVSGDTYINDVKVASGQSIRSPPAITVAFVPTSEASSIKKVLLVYRGTTWATTGNKELTGSLCTNGPACGKYTVALTLVPDTYSLQLQVATTTGVVYVLTIETTISENAPTEPVDVVHQIQQNWVIFCASLVIVSVVVAFYGYRRSQ